jgi:hypothetical protein
LRSVLRAHSSAETITAVGFPLRVIVCGPARARSTTSDSRALAAANVQAPPEGGESDAFLIFTKTRPSMTCVTMLTTIAWPMLRAMFQSGLLSLAFVLLFDLIKNESQIA